MTGLLLRGLGVVLLLSGVGCVPQLQQVQQEAAGFVSGVLSLYALIWLIFILVAVSVTVFLFRKNPHFRRLWVPSVNAVRRILRLPPVYLLPTAYVTQEHLQVKTALQLVQDIEKAIKKSPQMSAENRRSIRKQIHNVSANMVALLSQLDRLRHLAALSGIDSPQEFEHLDFKLQVQIDHSFQTLKSIPLTLMKIEVASNDRVLKRLVNELTETNQKMRDVADTYVELQRARSRLGQ